MSIFTISDLHLSFGTDKPMDVFGWENHTERIKANWQRIVSEEDTVVLPGDFSWALKLEESFADFKFLESLPGKKLLLKGNHDLWWSTVKKVKEFFDKNGIKSVDLIFNNAQIVEDKAICGTRGWMFSSSEQDKKIIARESGRLRRSLEEAVKTGLKPLVFMHYPPAYGDEVCTEFIDILNEFCVDEVFYGHIHGNGFNNSIPEYKGIKLKLVSCDCMNFVPFRIK
ncbi:MAG: metallophosphoesterase [Acutalibacteraceae bacterium]|nr:metallophosphoesterase [Acutalibacteraceae bacterium]